LTESLMGGELVAEVNDAQERRRAAESPPWANWALEGDLE
jgi:hypothetical protein